MCVRVFGKQGALQSVPITVSTLSPLSQHLKGGFSLSPAPHHPARVHGCQETSSDTGAHGPERLQTDTQTDRPHSTAKYGQERRKRRGRTSIPGITLQQLKPLPKGISLTSNRLSPTSATSRLWPWRWRTMAAFSDAYMQVKSNMATSGWP